MYYLFILFSWNSNFTASAAAPGIQFPVAMKNSASLSWKKMTAPGPSSRRVRTSSSREERKGISKKTPPFIHRPTKNSASSKKNQQMLQITIYISMYTGYDIYSI